MTKSRARRTPPPKKSRTVSRPHDPAEVQADRAADVVARGGSVTGWSFGSVPVDAGVHREDKGKPSDEDKLKGAAKKAGEAALETEAGKKLQAQVKETPLVKKATELLDTTPGKVVAGGVIAAGVGGLAAARQPLPFQAPDIPLDKITPGLSAKVTVEGPLNAPTFVGLSLTYKEQVKGAQGGPTEKDRIAADTARLRALEHTFKPQAQKDQEKADEQAAIARYVASQQKLFGSSTLLPLKPADKPKTVDVPKADTGEPRKDEEGAPVQRESAPTAGHDTGDVDTSGVDHALRGGGRPLEDGTRRSMEARFGYDFSGVRVHDDAQSSTATAGVEARAFTVGQDIVFGHGESDPKTPAGRHLLAHELAHVVQQRGRHASDPGERLHRRSIFESIGIWLGLEEGTWSDQELRAYLGTLARTRTIDGSYDADNKARAVTRLWKRGAPGWDLDGPTKALLIDEMLDGPTLGDDEECILDLLELSDNSDLGLIFADAKTRIARLDSDINGDNRKRLDTLVAARFDGGRKELSAGNATLVGAPVPAGAPVFAFSAAGLDARLEARDADEMVALIDHFAADDRSRAVDHLLREVWPRTKDEIGRLRVDSYDLEGDKAQQNTDRQGELRYRDAKVERILHHYFAGDVRASRQELTGRTQAVDAARYQELRDVLRPKQYTPTTQPKTQPEPPAQKPGEKAPAQKPADQATKKAPTGFHDPDKYRAEIEKALPQLVKDIYDVHVTNAGPRAPISEIEGMAGVAKDETDAVFGSYYDKSAHQAMVVDKPGRPGNLHLWFETASAELKAMGPRQKKALAIQWVKYYFQAQQVIRDINEKYLANPEYASGKPKNPEAKLLEKIADTVSDDGTMRDQLLLARRSWRGMASGGNVWVDLYHDADVDTDRTNCWRMLQTLVHEYTHTLRNDTYTDYAKSFGGSSVQWNTLVEGVDEVIALSVWDHVRPKAGDLGLRTVVEGAVHAKLPAIAPPEPGHYKSYEEALRLTSLVGFDNLCAAYFLGLVDRVSAPAPKAEAKAKGATP